MNGLSRNILVAILATALIGVVGCPIAPTTDNGNTNDNGNANDNTNDNTNTNDNSSSSADFDNASAARGGLLFDEWWEVLGVDAPTDDHPLWATRPDTTSNTRTGSDTWRCKECHGWDYKGVDGAYSSGSHSTGIAGIFGTAATAQEVFDNVKTSHGFGDAGLADADIWDLTKFVLEGLVDTDDVIDADGAFTGDATNGETLYTTGLGGALACSICHGADGRTLDFGGGEFVGTVAFDNPWEFLHKVRFGQPGTSMPGSVTDGASIDDVVDLSTYSQTLPTQ